MHPTLSNLKLKSARLSAENWAGILKDAAKRNLLEDQLSKILTPNITRYLPSSMQFSADHGSISKWVSDLAAEAHVLCVRSRETAALVGIIILGDDPEPNPIPSIHLGYFLGENDWGNGYATELVLALVSAFETGPRTRLVAGVDRSNAASVRVLEKSGFNPMQEQSTAEHLMFEVTVS